jgi:hypothetical protein
MRRLREQYPESPALPDDASETRAAMMGAIALTFGALLPVVVLSFIADWSFLGASPRAGDSAEWLLRMATLATLVGVPSFLLLRKVIRRSFEERRRL